MCAKLRDDLLLFTQTLQRELAKVKGVAVSACTVRRHLGMAGFTWLPRSKKRKYGPKERAARRAFAQEILDLTLSQLKARLQFAMDGVVLTIPPKDPIARENFVRTDDQFVWRSPHEKDLPELAGHDAYAKQTPPCRSLPLWGGIAFGGFGVVLHHPRRKVTAGEWAAAVAKGDLVKALRQANPGRLRGPWNILCDNESFLRGTTGKTVGGRYF